MNTNEKASHEKGMASAIVASQATTPRTVQKPENRQSTPDSEALVSSDDEGDRTGLHRHTQLQQKPVSSANRINDTSSNIPQLRKASFASNSLSPTSSHQSTKSTDAGIWTHPVQGSNSMNRGHPVPSKFPWVNGIWNTDTRVDPPPRLTEVSSSSSARGPQLSPSNGSTEGQLANATIPFPIPLHPTPKTYRSQSYSVGQLDPEAPASIRSHINLGSGGRVRNFQHIGLQHRPSRPSALSEMSNKGILGNVYEVDDHKINDKAENRMHRISLVSNEVKSSEVLTRERSSIHKQQPTFCFQYGVPTDNAFSHSLRFTLDELDSAIDELDDASENLTKSFLRENHGRRFSELSFNNAKVETHVRIENRKLENVKKASWQSSLGFGGLRDNSQSRRHSFAEVPTRHAAIGTNSEAISLQDKVFEETKSTKDYSTKFQEQKSYSFNENHMSFFYGNFPYPRSAGTIAYHQSARSSAVPTQYCSASSGPPQSNMYISNQSRKVHALSIVVFKSSRSDVFYVQEGTGLSVKPGDRVIVEADRGTDLGTVARTNIDWATAKEFRDYYSREHYTCLSAKSQSRKIPPESSGPSLAASSISCQGSTAGCMGPSTQHGLQELYSCDLKPKLIKRLAQKHEIDASREKEGSEAKAKRVCMQKVLEHGLNMDILDAEFQMDWKKLTFYYFADSYINFNSLVTDLFKIYKTRIWMSAINPASFPCSSISLQTPIHSGPVIKSVQSINKNERNSSLIEQLKSPCASKNLRGAQFPYTQQSITPLDSSINTFSTPPFLFGFSPCFGTNSRDSTIPSNSVLKIDPLVDLIPQSDFQRHSIRFSAQHTTLPTRTNNNFSQGPILNPNEAWMKSFLGLSMNSR